MTGFNVARMTMPELEARLAEVLQELAQINSQLDRAKANAAATGDYSDRDWFNRAKGAKRAKGIEHQMIQMELGRRRKADNRAWNSMVERRFCDAAKRRLPSELFAELMAEANAEATAIMGARA